MAEPPKAAKAETRPVLAAGLAAGSAEEDPDDEAEEQVGTPRNSRRPPHCVFPNAGVFEMLLRAREGKMDESLAVRSSASPIDISLPERCFYVCAEDNLMRTRGRAHQNEICVKYNNCARSRVWWSPEHDNKLGMVARKMGMKSRSAREGRHGFEGHWLTLVERPDATPIADKTELRKFILPTAPSLVQFWSIGGPGAQSDADSSPGGDGGSSLVSSPKSRLVLDEEDSAYYHASMGVPAAAIPPAAIPVAAIQAAAIASAPLAPAGKRPFGHAMQREPPPQPSWAGATSEHDRQQQQLQSGNLEDASELSFLVDALDAEDLQAPSSHPHQAIMASASAGASASGAKLARTAPAAPAGALAADGGGTAEEEDRLENSLVAYEIFRGVCETFTEQEFKRWYDLFAATLFLPNVARGLKYFLDRGDPRLRADFMFSSKCMFLPDLPIARLEYSGSYAKGFRLTGVDPLAQTILGLVEHEVLGHEGVYESLVESKMMLICQHLFFKQMVAQNEINISQYWFHTILVVAGRRIVIRGYSKVVSNFGDIDNELRTLDFQDASEAYQSILDLPPLPC
jgi:hypothetical protein